jgi:TPP-dependent pyruvate/acetoin dehydrogenase alpha subunit
MNIPLAEIKKAVKKAPPKRAYNKSLTDVEAIDVFRRMCLTRYFELQVIEAYKKGLIKCPVYLSIGQESISATVATLISGYHIFAQHRAHSVYLAFGGNIEALIDELLGLDTGCNKGVGGSPCVQDDNIKMIGHHGLIGENVPLAVGFALASNLPTVCFFGDAAAEEDYVFSSMGFAQTHKLPILFICEDNNLSILTEKKVRRNWELAHATKAIGMPSADISDDPWEIAYYIKQFGEIPAFLNCRTCRHHWHVGVGVDNEPEWDRFEMVKEKLGSDGIVLEADARSYMEGLWAKHLQKLSER